MCAANYGAQCVPSNILDQTIEVFILIMTVVCITECAVYKESREKFSPSIRWEGTRGLIPVLLGMMWISVVGLNRGKLTVRQEDIKPTLVAWWDLVPGVFDCKGRDTEKKHWRDVWIYIERVSNLCGAGIGDPRAKFPPWVSSDFHIENVNLEV